MDKLESGLCWQIEKREGITGPDHSRCFEGIAPGMLGKTDEIAVSDVLGHELLG